MLFAIDNSGSVGGDARYWGVVKRLTDGADGTILFWNSTSYIADRSELARQISRCNGEGGTEPHYVAKYIAESKFRGKLVLITDGQVDARSVARCDEFLPPDALTDVECHIVSGGEPNLSVTCPFTRNGATRVVAYTPGGSHVVQETSSATFAILDNIGKINTVAEFRRAYEDLLTAIRARNMGRTGLPSVKADLLRLQARLVVDTVKGADAAPTPFACLPKDPEGALKELRQMEAGYGGKRKVAYTWTSDMNRLISYSGDMSNKFDLRTRLDAADTAAEVDDGEIPLIDASAGDFECPITLDGDTPAILMRRPAATIFEGFGRPVVEGCTVNPLNVLNYPELVDRVRALLDHPIGVSALKSMPKPMQSPITRAPICGALTLGADSKHRDAANWTLATALTGGKLLGNSDLWFMTVATIAMRTEYLKPIAGDIMRHLQFRMATLTPAALTGISTFNITRVPLSAALWYVVHSPLANPDVEASGSCNALRLHLDAAGHILGLLRLIEYPILPGVERHISRLQFFTRSYLLLKSSEVSAANILQVARKYRIHNLFRGLFQKTTFVRLEDQEVPIPLDGPASIASIEKIRGILRVPPTMSIAEAYSLYKLIRPTVALTDCRLPFNWMPDALPAPTREWKYNESAAVSSDIPVCPRTMRPYCPDWRAKARDMWSVPDTELFSGNERFVQFVEQFKRYPTRDEYIAFCYGRYHESTAKKHENLPEFIEVFTSDILSSYAAALKVAPSTPEEFIEITLSSREMKNREFMEAWRAAT